MSRPVRYNKPMLREPFTTDSYVHVVKRGARGLNIFNNKNDMNRCLLMLRHFNDTGLSQNWYRDLIEENLIDTFNRPGSWEDQDPLVAILAYTLMPNHFHLLLKEVKEGGIPTFMNKLGKGMTQHANAKYLQLGSMFQGPYRSKVIEEDIHFKCTSMYIMVKNVFELYPGGFKVALRNFDKAYIWALSYKYSSFPDYNGQRDNSIINKEFLGELFPTPKDFKTFAKDYILGRAVDEEIYPQVSFE